MAEIPVVSVVVPCFNELDNIEPLIGELRSVIEPLGKPFEIIYVDDCSNDGSREKLRELTGTMPFLRLVCHKRNFGESAGELTGFANARGETIVTIDADLQNDPADIPAMLKLLETHDCVAGVRRKREDTGTKRMSSRVANWTRDAMLHDDIHDAGCTFRALRASALRGLPSFRALHRFLPSILKWHGYRVVEMPVNDRPRTRGKSKYGVGNRLWVGIADLFGMRWYRARNLPPDRWE